MMVGTLVIGLIAVALLAAVALWGGDQGRTKARKLRLAALGVTLALAPVTVVLTHQGVLPQEGRNPVSTTVLMLGVIPALLTAVPAALGRAGRVVVIVATWSCGLVFLLYSVYLSLAAPAFVFLPSALLLIGAGVAETAGLSGGAWRQRRSPGSGRR